MAHNIGCSPVTNCNQRRARGIVTAAARLAFSLAAINTIALRSRRDHRVAATSCSSGSSKGRNLVGLPGRFQFIDDSRQWRLGDRSSVLVATEFSSRRAEPRDLSARLQMSQPHDRLRSRRNLVRPSGLRAGSPPPRPPRSIRPAVRRLLRSPRLSGPGPHQF